MGTSILITSGKGGTGKTACAAAIASALASLSHRTLCVDCDAALRNLDLTLGLSDQVLWDFADVLNGEVPASEAPVPHPRIKDLWFLSAPADIPEDVSPDAFVRMIDVYREEYDYVILDSPAGIGAGFRLAAPASDLAVIVATGDLTSLRDGQRVAQELRALGVSELRLLVNRVSPRAFRRVRRSVDEVIDTVGARLIGVVSEDEDVSEALNRQTPLLLYGSRRALPQLQNIARRLTGERIPLGRI